jgi:hypothetical protein
MTYRSVWLLYYFSSLGYAKDALYWPILATIGLMEMPLVRRLCSLCRVRCVYLCLALWLQCAIHALC